MYGKFSHFQESAEELNLKERIDLANELLDSEVVFIFRDLMLGLRST
jgi:hypothetical protein